MPHTPLPFKSNTHTSRLKNTATNKIKLTLVLHSPKGGGAERFFINLARNLDRKKFHLSLILFNAQGEYADLIPRDIPIFELKMPLPGHVELIHPKWIIKLSTLIRQTKPDLIFSTLGLTNLMTILARLISFHRCPLIIRETIIQSPHLAREKNIMFRKSVYKMFYPLADVIVAPSRACLDDLKETFNIKIKTSKVIPNCIDSPFVQMKLQEPLPLNFINLKKDKPVIISVGRLTYLKGIDIALRAIHSLQKRLPCYYWILGQGEELDCLKRYVDSHQLTDKVRFLGFQPNPYIFLKNADVFLMPSRNSEGFPNALLEAMYCGLPSLTTHYNSSVEDLVNDQIDGMIVDTENAYQLENALFKVLTDDVLKTSLGKNASKKARNFDVAHIVQQYEDLFINLLETAVKPND